MTGVTGRVRLPPRVGQLLLPAALLAGSFVPGTAHNGIALDELDRRSWGVAGVVLLVAQSLPLVVARRVPASVLAVVGVAFAVFEIVGYESGFATLGLLVAIYAAARHSRAPRVVAALALAGYAVLAVILSVRGSPERVADFVTFGLVLAGAWLVGRLVRGQAAANAAREAVAAEQAVAAERRRLASELHDVVTHHVTAMIVQAGAAELLPGGDPRVTESLTVIGDVGREALTDLRELLVLLAAEPGAASRRPSLQGVRSLVDSTRRSGHPVALAEPAATLDGVPDAVALTAYRVVQEALTNAVKYSDGVRTRVRLERLGTRIEVEVTSGLTPGGLPASTGSGYGLVGLRERVADVGGTFSAAPDDGLFVVRAVLPVSPGAR